MTSLIATVTGFSQMLGYVGPGAGIGLIAALVGVLAALGSALLFVILYPLRLLRRKRQAAKARNELTEAQSPTTAEASAPSHPTSSS